MHNFCMAHFLSLALFIVSIKLICKISHCVDVDTERYRSDVSYLPFGGESSHAVQLCLEDTSARQ